MRNSEKTDKDLKKKKLDLKILLDNCKVDKETGSLNMIKPIENVKSLLGNLKIQIEDIKMQTENTKILAENTKT